MGTTLLPVSVDGMIAASSKSLLLDSRHGRRSGLLPWTLLIVGSVVSLGAGAVPPMEPAYGVRCPDEGAGLVGGLDRGAAAQF
jgi:hypothetical protein